MTLLTEDEQKISQQLSQPLSQHFTLNEFIRSATTAKLHIDNTAPPDVLNNLRRLAQYCEQVRAELGSVPMIISSGYRCTELNTVVGGAANSSHLYGLACDFTAPGFGSPFAVCKKLASSTILFDQLILERTAKTEWVHLGIAAKDKTPRRQLLTIDRNGTRVGLWKD